jgi:glycogen debranching enzyme
VKLVEGGAEVTLFSRHGTKAWMCLFDGGRETARILLEKHGEHFSGFVPGVKHGDAYGFRADGPWKPELGHRFDVNKLLIDPYATQLDRPFVFHSDLAVRSSETAHLVPKSIVQRGLPDVPLRKLSAPRLIYELGVKSFTKLHPDIPPEKLGTVSALAEPVIISHLKQLGVDTVELMPVHAWIDERHLPPLGLHNAWGYNPVQFFALDPRLAPGGLQELRDTVAALHREGIQVILDVVFNHSGESDLLGPTLCFRGLDNATYYAQTTGELHNDTGCGNTLALNEAPITDMVLRSLRHFVLKAGIDGFRFDLATVLGRTPNGFDRAAPLLRAIEADPVLTSRIMIAEPWDIGPGGYQLGNFPDRWLEWNDQYRDDVRRFWRGDERSANGLATRVCGSSDVFASRKPSCSVNFIAAHDGFSLRDTVTYSAKHNAANGEGNRDGKSDEVTWPDGDVRALLATLFLSRGTLMLTAGDEFGRTQQGNNNAYAQDNEITWLDWASKDDTLFTFVKSLAEFCRQYSKWFTNNFVSGDESFWFGSDGLALDWNRPDNRFVGLLLRNSGERLAIVFNSGEAAAMKLVPSRGKTWTKVFYSAQGGDCPAKSVSIFFEALQASKA